MKKALLYILLAGFIAYSGYSQSLSLSDSAGPLSNNQTIIKYGSPSIDEIVAHVFVTNTTANPINVKCKKVEQVALPNTVNLFCWGLCFAPSVFVSPDPLVIAGGATNTADFSGHYTPNGVVGISNIRYVFFNSDIVTDTVCINIQYSTYPLGVDNHNKGYSLSSPFPNPAADVVNFDYMLSGGMNGLLVVRNAIGAEVKTINMNELSGRITLSTFGLNDGIYFFNFIINGHQELNRKFVVRH